MEYFIGSAITLVFLLSTMFFIKKILKNKKVGMQIRYSQSTVFGILAPFLPEDVNKRVIPSQRTKHFSKINIKILFLDDEAYWIKENTFYKADIVDGEIDNETTAPVDTMAMDQVQLKKMIFIIEQLTKDSNNDYWNSR